MKKRINTKQYQACIALLCTVLCLTGFGTVLSAETTEQKPYKQQIVPPRTDDRKVIEIQPDKKATESKVKLPQERLKSVKKSTGKKKPGKIARPTTEARKNTGSLGAMNFSNINYVARSHITRMETTQPGALNFSNINYVAKKP